MARFIHRQNDSRVCGASTVTRCSNVRVNGQFISIEGDTNTHGGGKLRATETTGKVRVNNEPVILQNDPADSDKLCGVPGHEGHGHCEPSARSASPNVRAGGNNGG
jgi:uncharacterized Zn-binding protein involved in type VI secretion